MSWTLVLSNRYPRTAAAAEANRRMPYGIRPPEMPSLAERRLLEGAWPIRYCAVLLAVAIWAFAGGAIMTNFG